MSAAAEAAPSPNLATGRPSPASISSSSKSSSFCSFDVRIWEELHLQSLLSSATNNEHVETGVGQQLWKAEKIKESRGQSHTQGFSFCSPSVQQGASFSGFLSPHRLSNASSQSGHPLLPFSSRRDNILLVSSPHHYIAEQPPVVQVIQTGSMSFSSHELVIQQASMHSAAGTSLASMENFNSAVCKTTPQLEPEEPSFNHSANMVEKSIVLGTLPNAKFLQMPPPDVYSAPISPLKSAGSIPFKWEEKPGKPKLNADHPHLQPTVPSLQLPPKLLHSSFSSSNCSSPYSRSRSKHGASSSPSSGDRILSKSGSVKSLWHSFVQSAGRKSYREGGGRSQWSGLLISDEDPWSPTSTLIGPDVGLSSSSSTSSTLDAICASPGRIPEVQSALRRVWPSNADDGTSFSQRTALMPASSSSSLSEASAYIGNDLPNFAPSMERKMKRTIRGMASDKLKGFLKSCQRWKGSVAHRKRNHEEVEMWEPTLATYFHSLELGRTSTSMSGQSLLHEQGSLEKCSNESNLALTATSASSTETVTCNIYVNENYDVLKEDGMVIFSGKPSCMEKCSMGLKGKNVKVKRKGRGWALRKLKKSSKVLAALLKAVSRSTSRGSESNKKCKRTRLPYQTIEW